MKKLHLVTSNDELRPAMTYIQVKGGNVYATNAHVMVKFPINEVFGVNVFSDTDEYYIDSQQWKTLKFFNADAMGLVNGVLKAYKRGKFLGMMDVMSAEDFNNKVGKFPNCEAVIPQSGAEPVEAISFSPEYYYNLTECFNLAKSMFKMNFRGTNKVIMVENTTGDSAGLGLIMPILF